MAKAKILVIDDEPNIQELVGLYLRNAGFEVISSLTGEDGMREFGSTAPDLVMLDIMLPGELDGRELCREMRKCSQVPILMLSACDTSLDKVVLLELGADDYLTKPFDPDELVARARALLRRAAVKATEESPAIVFDGLAIDPERREVKAGGVEVSLTTKEFDILTLIAQNPGIVFSRERLLELVWGYDFYGELRTVDVHVRHLREKLGDNAETPRFIATVWGAGYKFVGRRR